MRDIMEFKALKKGKINEVEKDILNYWEEIDILKRSIETRDESRPFVFYDGPAYANGLPGIHHVLAKELKDAFCKYKTMQGYRVDRKIGWDTHGLPTEVNVEKILGFNGKKDIENYGIEKFNAECKKNVRMNESEFVRLTKEMGQFIDTDDAYITFKNEYIESEWWILKQFFDAGLVYSDYRILPYCPRCGTALATHEVAEGYKEVSVNSVVVPFKLKDEDTYVLVWTTTPWTLLANVALCVHPKEEYIKVESKGYHFIIAKALASKILGDDYKVLETYQGKDLEYKEYEQLLPFLSVDKKGFYITCDEYVTMEDGTGIVHIAPAFGADDNLVGKRYDLPILCPVDSEGRYSDGPWKGRLVTDPDLELEILKYLKEQDKLFKKIKMTHNYPHCWRCKSPLIYIAKPSWYIRVTDFKDQIIEANKKVHWYPSYVGEKRFNNWLENLQDWGISRNRYWGCPIPLWICEECDHKEMIGSVRELVDRSIEEIDETIDLHKPYVDNVHLKCPKCGKTMHRIKDVIDVWFDSGSMPFAQYHYPFENKELFKKHFPADFIAEGIDQTRGWFYVLIVISTFLMKEAPYKNVLVNDLLLDAKGQKMHKSRGNAVDPFKIMEEYGADTVRFYLPYVSPVWTPIKFDVEGLKEIYSKYISTFRNAYSFFQMYANADGIDPREYDIPVAQRDITDQWLLSKLNRLIKTVTESYEAYDLTGVVKPVVEFLNDDFSNWYIRSNRRRFWASELTEDKKAVYLTTYEALLTLTKLIAPVTPFIAEEIYRNLTDKESVHLEQFPTYDAALIDEVIEERMDLVRDICSLGRFAREEVQIKVRQPIREVILPQKEEAIIGELVSIIKEELNVKDVLFISDMTQYMDYVIKPNFRVVGKILGPKIKAFQEALAKLSNQEIETLKDAALTISLEGEDFEVTADMVEVTIKVKEGYASSSNQQTFVILNTELTDDLIMEGIAREFVRKVQALRKEADFVITDHIKIYYSGDEKMAATVEAYRDYIQNETLAEVIEQRELEAEEVDMNGLLVKIEIERMEQ